MTLLEFLLQFEITTIDKRLELERGKNFSTSNFSNSKRGYVFEHLAHQYYSETTNIFKFVKLSNIEILCAY